MARRRPKPFDIEVESFNSDGRGVGYHNDGIVFVDGALPGEKVTALYKRKKAKAAEAFTLEVLEPSPERIEPACEHFFFCGGCSLQYYPAEKQAALKEELFFDTLKRLGDCIPKEKLPIITGGDFHYRRKARFGVRYDAKKGISHVGFRMKRSNHVVAMKRCPIMDEAVADMPAKLSELVTSLSVRARLPQIEIVSAPSGKAMIVRHLDGLTDEDKELLREFARTHSINCFLQPGNESTIHLHEKIHPELLSYELKDFGLTIHFAPEDFIQVNGRVNELMIKQAVDLLELEAEDHVLDLFCGLGNFSLPIAKFAQSVWAADAAGGAVKRGLYNAAQNNLHNITFKELDLYADINKLFSGVEDHQNGINKVLLDPPRSGAFDFVKHIGRLGEQLTTICYVSCNPATLARDIKELQNAGFVVEKAGAMDMFPHTGHVESIALLKRS